jgi:release factor glutamine methyltransferase
MSIADLRTKYREELSGKYPAGETDAIFFLLLQHYAGITRTGFFSGNGNALPEENMVSMNSALQRLRNHEPVQYIIGEMEFCGLRIKVNPSVLIPRPETEEMVQLIKSQISNPEFQMIDVCSGSGCIAIAMKNYFPRAAVMALELSEEAIAMAKENAHLNQTEINFVRGDVFNPPAELKNYTFDILVSNPPYVLPSEKDSMGPNVYDHEPQVAVFVPENKPLMFYDAISSLALKRLKPGGTLWFESDEDRADDVGNLVRGKKFADVKVHTDLSGKKRFISARSV